MKFLEVKDVPLEFSMSSSLQLPEDAYECVITEIVEAEQTDVKYRRKQVGGVFHFQIMHGPFAGKTFTSFFTNKVTKKSKLSILIRAIFGRELEPEEMAQLEIVSDLNRFLLNKPLNVVLLHRISALGNLWYDVAFFFKSEYYDERLNTTIMPKGDL